MTDDRSFERAARSWLEIGPTDAPERAIEAAFLEIDTTPRERDWRVPWRLPKMNPPARALVGVAAVVALLLGGVVLLPALTGPIGGPSGTPTASPSASPASRFSLKASFTSRLMGYSIKIADGWVAEPATIPWDTATDNDPPGVDSITMTGTDSSLGIASQPIPAGSTYEQFLGRFHQNTIAGVPAGCDGGDPSTWKPVQIGPETGVLQQLCNATIAFADVGGRIYRFAWGNETFNADQHITEAEFKDLLKTVTFAPSSGVVPLVLTGTFASPSYGYSIGIGDGWTTTPATKAWVGYTNIEPFVDDIKAPGTDSTISVGSQALPAGTTFDAWVAAYHAKTSGDVPAGCDGGDPSTWGTTPIGPETGHYALLCNAVDALVEVGGRVYVFTLGNATIGGTPHLSTPQFLQTLTTVTFDPAVAVPSIAP